MCVAMCVYVSVCMCMCPQQLTSMLTFTVTLTGRPRVVRKKSAKRKAKAVVTGRSACELVSE